MFNCRDGLLSLTVVTLGNNDLAFHSAFFLVLLSEVTTGKKGLTQFSFGAAQKIIYWAWWKEQET